MGRQIDKSNIGYLDIDFQYKLAKIFVEDSKFFESVASIVDQNAFTDSLLRKFVGTIKDYYSKESLIPSYDMLNIILREKSKTNTDIEEVDALIKKLKFETSLEGYIFVKDVALKFFKQQNLIRVANKILEIAGKGDIDRYAECQQLLDDASMVGQEDDFGYDIYELQDKALSNDYTVSIPTGISMLDDVLGGGLDKGKLGLLIAPAGFGKTSFTTAIDSFAATYKCDMNNHMGFKVLQIYFEDDDVDITRKHYSRLTQREARFMKRLDKPERDEIAELLNNHADKDMLKANLRLKHFKTGTKSASDIEIFVKKLINQGFKPDLISIDYFECLAPEKGGYNTDTEWTREGVTMRKLENMAKDLDCAIWIPTQGTKDSMNSPEVVRMDQASGSAKKIHVAQLILSIARAIDDIDKSRAVIGILKNRSGKSGKVFNNVYFDNGTCTISCSDTVEFDSQLAWDEEASRQREKLRIDMTRGLVAKQDTDEKHVTEGNFIGVLPDGGEFKV
jgi:replicative DNA helicase